MSATPGFPAQQRPGRPRKGEAAQRRDHLIRIAAELFLARGYHLVSLAAIAGAARVAVRTIYGDFGGKPGLLAAVLQARWSRFVEESGLPDPAHRMEAALADFGLRWLRFLADPELRRLHRLALTELDDHPASAPAWRDAGIAQLRTLLADYFSDARVRTRLRPNLAPDLLTTHFMACLAGDLLWPGAHSCTGPAEPALQAQVQTRLALFLRAVGH